ncbi:hypothetical protein NEOLI_001455 [Neolecta irregularis DAH-3]|uniref:Alpha-ketoglutarate-dependent dioxygenase AlkB-like domain-containing protein n=1 Tax=Neolecta irregularis (strain DAH-3) TaxID=1198029 RepID=A0A1U7LG51_NEOID|nr:hypothetical protein NEOLI_001455 [Neolecta irregularis DAH-3]|eukprot:OLL21634.1 hypothetical protein NEOLI_001455 [Neolecta irregularis DAH-3]
MRDPSTFIEPFQDLFEGSNIRVTRRMKQEVLGIRNISDKHKSSRHIKPPRPHKRSINWNPDQSSHVQNRDIDYPSIQNMDPMTADAINPSLVRRRLFSSSEWFMQPEAFQFGSSRADSSFTTLQEPNAEKFQIPPIPIIGSALPYRVENTSRLPFRSQISDHEEFHVRTRDSAFKKISLAQNDTPGLQRFTGEHANFQNLIPQAVDVSTSLTTSIGPFMQQDRPAQFERYPIHLVPSAPKDVPHVPGTWQKYPSLIPLIPKPPLKVQPNGKSLGFSTDHIPVQKITQNHRRASGHYPNNFGNEYIQSHVHCTNQKPECIGKPKVWANTRQELCEGLSYFRSYQGGCYYHNGLVFGYLVDGFGSPRDYVGPNVVISHGGGKSQMDPKTGICTLQDDQLVTDKAISALLNNFAKNIPLVLLIGKNCDAAPAKLCTPYAVMDWFVITYMWPEKDPISGFIRWKLKFEKLTPGPGWWTPITLQTSKMYSDENGLGIFESTSTSFADYRSKFDQAAMNFGDQASCLCCHRPFVRVFEEDWTCLNSECAWFWHNSSCRDLSEHANYSKEFLSLTLQPTTIVPHDLRIPLPRNADEFYNSKDISKIFWRGFCCAVCGKVSCREFWRGWICSGCGFEFCPPRTTYTAASLACPYAPVYTGLPIITGDRIFHESGVQSEEFTLENMRVAKYSLKDCGYVYHIVANQSGNIEADDLFYRYQTENVKFQRHELTTHRITGRLLTQQFTFNAGKSYKHVVSMNTTPFDETPAVIRDTLTALNNRIRKVNLGVDPRFNEILSIAYMEGQKMGYHDDGEESVGDVIASISFGSSATMRFRRKKKLLKPTTAKAGIDNLDLPDIQSGMNNRQLPVPGKVVLELKLNHGDVMIMWGRRIQRDYVV